MGSGQQLANWRNAHSHGNQYSTIMQQPSLLTNHVTLPTAQPLNVGVAHVVRQQESSSLPSKKNKQSAPVSSKSSLDALPSQVYSLFRSSPVHNTSSYNSLVPVQDQHQPIIIPDTPSPPVSVITIQSDTDEEEDNKYKPSSSGLKLRSNVISYVTVNDSPDSDSSLRSPYSTDTLSALQGNSGPLLEGPGRVVADGAGTLTIIVPPLKTQLGDCTVVTQTSSLLSSKTKPVVSGSSRHAAAYSTHPSLLVHQVPVSVGPSLLTSASVAPAQYHYQFATQSYIGSSRGSAIYTGYPLSPTKISQYSYL
ncbi:Homeodomain-interacting protein kinase 1 [Heterocephalus glaber]|uniref:Homeodomain-interacting protein kinase 1 n=1 Tax=Heterocephalus glaber TaxID=10181 RepID=G5BDW6_HETGA|nr:Homeodomain-interacting protein kinase 1 [Heterocephalus glaber]